MTDFRYALRGFRRAPAAAIVAVLSLTVGIGASTAIFSVTNAVILRSLPVHDPDSLVVLRYVSAKGNIFDTFSYSDYLVFRDTPGALSPGDVPSPVNPPPGCAFHTRCGYAQERCRRETPPLREVAPGHWVSCHFR